MSAIPQSAPQKLRDRLDYLWLAVCFGLLTGLFEAGYLLWRKFSGQTWFLFVPQDMVWMTALANVVFFLLFGVVLFGLSFVVPARKLLAGAFFLFGFGLFMAIFLAALPQVHWAATVMLAIGLSSAIIRKIGPRLPDLLPTVRRTTLLLGGLQVVVALVFVGSRAWNESRELAALTSPRKNAPNVIVMTWDTVRAKNVSLHGYHRDTTPNLKKWSDKGTQFRNAFATAPWTLPSHASMFTGRYPQEVTGSWQLPLDTRYPTLAEVMRDQGYETAGFVGNRFFTNYETGLTRGFIHYEDFSYSIDQYVTCCGIARRIFDFGPVRHALDFYTWYGHVTAGDVNTRFSNWLNDRQADRPFFVFLNYFDSHDPYLPPAPFDTKFGPKPTADDKMMMLRWGPEVANLDEPPGRDKVDRAVEMYDGGIAYQDHCLGQLLESLQDRGLLENTLVVITADHGEHFGEHGFYMHGHTLYRDQVHVPLVVYYPRAVEAGKVIEEPVTLRDLPATVLELAGIKSATTLPGYSWFHGQGSEGQASYESRSPIFQVAMPIPGDKVRPANGRSPVAGGNMVSLLMKEKYYIKNFGTGAEELFDFRNDVNEANNLALQPGGEELLGPYRVELKRIMEQHDNWWEIGIPKDDDGSKAPGQTIAESGGKP